MADLRLELRLSDSTVQVFNHYAMLFLKDLSLKQINKKSQEKVPEAMEIPCVVKFYVFGSCMTNLFLLQSRTLLLFYFQREMICLDFTSIIHCQWENTCFSEVTKCKAVAVTTMTFVHHGITCLLQLPSKEIISTQESYIFSFILQLMDNTTGYKNSHILSKCKRSRKCICVHRMK